MTIRIPELSRRSVLAGSGALVLSFSLTRAFGQETGQPGGQNQQAQGPQPPKPPQLPGDLNDTRMLDAWIRIDASGKITVFTGKAELGTGVKTALQQVAAEELEVPFDGLELITADTGRTPDEGFTAGSMTMSESGTAIRNAAAQVRDLLINVAAQKLMVGADQLHAENGAVVGPMGQKLGYGELVSDQLLHVEAQPMSRLKDPKDFRIMGKDQPRVDIPGKVTGAPMYVQDIRMPNMAHARVVRPPSPGATLKTTDFSAIEKMPGVVKVVRDGSYLAVIADREFQAVKAMRALAAAAMWDEKPTMPKDSEVYDALLKLPSTPLTDKDQGMAPAMPAKTLEARFTRPYQMHGSIGPSAAVGQFTGGMLTVWTHTQGVYPDRDAIAEMLGMPKETVRCIHVEGSGCYGHNGADDAAADAAYLAKALPDRPVRVQFMREQEHAWEPYGPAMVSQAKASLDAMGSIVDWNYEVWSNPHGTRPGPAGALLSARYLEKPFQLPVPPARTSATGSGDRNAVPLYEFPSTHVVWHFLADMPVRISSLRSLGAYMNVFALESFMDELAMTAGADPVDFRLKHLKDPRAIDVVAKTAEAFGWKSTPAEGKGRGFAFAKYKNLASYFAVACEVEVDRTTGRVRMTRAVGTIDSGEAVNPDGLKLQSEGGILQALSWTLYEQVRNDDTRITSVDWASYPILRFGAVPDSIEINVIPRPGQPFLGAGEAAQGPTAAAVGNAIANFVGKRFRDLPITSDKVRAAMGV